jgi:ribonuclease BN (tRNA processing enzyme)
MVLGCNGPYPAPGGACSGYLLESGGRFLLLDAGSGVAGRLFQQTTLERLDGLILSHLHWDHCSDAFALSNAIQFALKDGTLDAPLPLLMPDSPQPIADILLSDANYSPQLFDSRREQRIGGWLVTCTPVKHPVPAYAVRVRHESEPLCSIVYTGDTNVHPPLAMFSKGADLLIADSAFLLSEWSDEAPHMSASHAAELALSANVEKLMLTHFRPEANVKAIEEEAMNIFDRIVCAKQGLRVTVAPAPTARE